MAHTLEQFIRFLDHSPTVFHGAREVTNALAEAGFSPLREEEKWRFEPGKGYFLMREEAVVAAFRVPRKAPVSATILASHLDSPCLKIKPHPEFSTRDIGQLTTEVYGAPLLHTWLDRDLMITGKIQVLDASGKRQALLVNLDDYPVIIPGIALHLDRSVIDKGILVHKQDHLKPIFSLKAREKHLEDWLHKHHDFQKLVSYDLFLVPAEKASFLGFDSELIASHRLDNLTSAYACLSALTAAKSRPDVLQMAFFWDHEEIGSESYRGAGSFFADQVLERICLSFKMDREDYYRFKSRSLCLSCDAAHGYHPNFADKYDPQNAPFLGKGPTLKFNANQKYTTTSDTAAPLLQLAEKHNLPLQRYASRSDLLSGSTVGPIMAANLGIPTLDLGITCWAMHSARETCAAQDELSLCALLKVALEE